jgi:hypothetical protein
MCPDVSGLGVDPEDGSEACGERGKLGPVSEVEIVVISAKEKKQILDYKTNLI